MIDVVPPQGLESHNNLRVQEVAEVSLDGVQSDPYAQYQFAAEVERLRENHRSQSVASLDFASSLMTEFGRTVQENDEQNAAFMQSTTEGFEDRLGEMKRRHTELQESKKDNDANEWSPEEFQRILSTQQKMSIEGLEMTMKLEELKHQANRNTIDLMLCNNLSKQTQEHLRRLTSEG